MIISLSSIFGISNWINCGERDFCILNTKKKFKFYEFAFNSQWIFSIFFNKPAQKNLHASSVWESFLPKGIHQEGQLGTGRVNKKLLLLFRAVPAIYTCRQQKHSFSADVIIDFSLLHSTVKAKNNWDTPEISSTKKVFWWLKFRWGYEKWTEMKRKNSKFDTLCTRR